ncbi:MAG TPA: histidine phosphatase family protein [Gemmatimonadaceae bacterium]|jgi:phosphohistidine phosphatase|nr:histidine phosphatase family protein [Gemmatimonadaceae bacterium]
MRLLIIRHAIAGDKTEFAKTGQSDDLRPITADGRDKMERAADGLREVVPTISLLASSPLTRAAQTAEIIALEYDIPIDETIDALRPDAPFDDFLGWLTTRAARDIIAVVGHEPHLSGLISWLISGGAKFRIDLKKGGACLLEFGGAPERGCAILLWSIPPAQLRALGR